MPVGKVTTRCVGVWKNYITTKDLDPKAVREKKGLGRSVTRRYVALGVGSGLRVREKSEMYRTRKYRGRE